MGKRLLLGKNAIITGCARGMGHKMMEVFAENGANLWACARKQTEQFEQDVKDFSEKYDVRITPVYFELTDSNEMKQAVKQIMSAKQPIDILINNAGITYNALFQMSTIEQIHNTLEVNFVAPFLFTQYIVKLMLRNGGGSIVNIASSAGQDGNSGRSVYGASKAAVICATKALAEELGVKGIRANAIAPGITNTDMLSSMTEEVIQETVNNTDMKRLGQPLDIANAALFLASDLSSYMTGQVLRVDGCLQ
jgi:3-oxoacyl-[acyl-carrier protein] reductase